MTKSFISHPTPSPCTEDGPFIVAPDPDGIHPEIYIAEIVREDDEGRIASPEQQRANASLISAAPQILHQLEDLAELVEAHLVHGDVSDEAFAKELRRSTAVMARAKRRVITIRVEAGMVQEVTGVPRGCELRVEDYDTADISHPAWDKEKSCFVTTYNGNEM